MSAFASSGFTLTANRGIALGTNNGTVAVAAAQKLDYAGIVAGSNSLTKSGNGTFTLSGANTYSGATAVTAGTLELANSSGQALGSTASLSVTGATLLLSQSEQVNNAAAISLSGGTITLASGVSETFGALSLTGNNTLDYGTGAIGNISFGTYNPPTPSALLAVNNFLEGNTLVFKSNLSSFIPSLQGGGFSSDYFTFDNGFVSAWDEGSSTFTITAIPEPSTYVAVAGLLGLMLWPLRRRLLRNAAKRA